MAVDAPAHRRHGRRTLTAIAVVIAVLAGVNVLDRFGPAHTGLVVGPLR